MRWRGFNSRYPNYAKLFIIIINQHNRKYAHKALTSYKYMEIP